MRLTRKFVKELQGSSSSLQNSPSADIVPVSVDFFNVNGRWT